MALALGVAVFATYRLATDLAWMDGPGGLYARLRGWVMTGTGADSWLREGIGCPICWSFWLALPAAVAAGSWGWAIILYWLGIAGAAAFLIRLTGAPS